jgi:hypothetical protein
MVTGRLFGAALSARDNPVYLGFQKAVILRPPPYCAVQFGQVASARWVFILNCQSQLLGQIDVPLTFRCPMTST